MASASKPSGSSSIASASLKKLEAELSIAKRQIQASRLASVKEMIERNRSSLKGHTSRMLDSAMALAAASSSLPGQENSLSARLQNPLCRLGGLESAGEKEMVHVQEEIGSTAVVFGSSAGGKTAVRPTTLPFVKKIPTFTTWIFLDRNQRMAEDQSVVGRRQIYYDPYGDETLMYSDSEEENLAAREEKHTFSEGEDQLLWKALKDNEKNQEVFSTVAQFIGASPSQIEERYEVLMEKHSEKHMKNTEFSCEPESEGRQFLNKPLSAVLVSFDNLFCRRCLIFDCRLHGCSQSLILPSEKQSYGFELEENRSPCGDQCYLRKKDTNGRCGSISGTGSMCVKGSQTSSKKQETSRTSSMPKSKGILDVDTPTTEASIRSTGKRKALNVKNVPSRNLKTPAGCHSVDRKQNKLALSDASGLSLLSITDKSGDSEALETDQFESDEVHEYLEYPTITDISSASRESATEVIGNNGNAALLKNSSGSNKGKSVIFWSTLEKDLYSKGVEAFGKNCCLIARNLLPGLKTCIEVSDYMFNNGGALSSRAILKNSCSAATGNTGLEYMEKDAVSRTHQLRRKSKSRKRNPSKYTGHPSIRKRIGDGKQQIASQYTPCGCQQTCGKDCPCSNNSTCCEKYCGCSKSCRNRFRGCHCAKSQCRSRQCPCFAAGRECDPDVCRNCWISCGDGSLGEPPARGDGYQCGNMKLLLKQRQRILLGRSDIAGWGAFIKNPVLRNDYLGEYTGELISHKEADKRGKIYDLANSSFLFDLNDQYVLDAYRKGDKLKFANHSLTPNCYAKVMLVAGDHRVGIYAKENIEASEELFYDYHYGPEQAPDWAKKPEGSKRDDSSVSQKHAHKVA